MKEINTNIGIFNLKEEIGRGNFRKCYSVVEDKNVCIKLIKNNMKYYQKIQYFFRRNMNLYEVYIYMKLPSEIKSYFSEILDAGKSYSVLKRYVDYNDDFSKTVTEYGPIENEHFWKEIEKLFLYLKNNKLWFFDIFSAQNILVYKKNKKEWVPIIIDYKRFGRRFYFQQINLILKSEKIKKMNRKYSSLIRRNPYI